VAADATRPGPLHGWLKLRVVARARRQDGTETRRSWDQTNAVGGGIAWASGPWQATLAALYHTAGPRRRSGSSTRPCRTPSSSLAAATRCATTTTRSLDARVSRDFELSRGAVTVFAEVTNALDRGNQCCTDYAYRYEAGRLALDREYRHWLPVVPSVGVLWKY